MNEQIIKGISKELKIDTSQVEKTLNLLKEDNTIPFIARYRKEVTGNLDETKIRKIDEVYQYQLNLQNKKEDVKRLIKEKEMLTDEIEKNIDRAEKLVDVEDIYRPFKEKKKTKASEAIKKGLEPLAKLILSSNYNDINKEAEKFINDKVKTSKEAIKGAQYIISEIISDNAIYRKWIRNYTFNNGLLVSSRNKKTQDEDKTFEMYYDYSEKINQIKPHRILAINRGEKQKILRVKVKANEEMIYSYLNRKNNQQDNKLISEAIEDSYKRLIKPSIEREIRSELTEVASEQAIEVFSFNLENLLLQPPIKKRVVLGLDPAFRTGCKLAVIDDNGKLLEISVIYPHEPKNQKEESKKEVKKLIEKYKIEIIAIGNGTASRESEFFVAELIKEIDRKIEYIIVNEAGASVYSASKEAKKEFPKLQVEQRSAVSIGRRLQDPLAELVKIEPKSIGVGQYQHDVASKRLDESLTFVVSSVVNNVGVNANTASSHLLKYVSGLTKPTINKILKLRDKKGTIKNRKLLKKILSDKTYEQAIGFIRIIDGDNPLDKTGIHPESYETTLAILEKVNLDLKDIGTKQFNQSINEIDKSKIMEELNVDKYTLDDILEDLKKPLRDPRDEIASPILKSDILEFENLTVGMKLQGTVRNVVDFGAFIDIGLKNDGLAHISKLTNKYIKHPSEVVSVGDIVDCYVYSLENKKVSLSLLENKKN